MISRETSPRIDSLESVRGLAALLIVLFHIPGWNSTLFNIRIIQHGYLMVELFFVLSGFVIFRAYGNRLRSMKDVLRFEFLRFGRLYPVHLFFLMLFLIIEIAKYAAVSRFNLHIPNSQPFRENNWLAFVEQLFLVQDIGPTGNSLTFNIPAWSISVEFYTYLVFAFIVMRAPRKKLQIAFFIAAVSATLLTVGATFGFKDVLLCFTGFFLGCLTAAIPTARIPIWASSAGGPVLLAILLLLYSPTGSAFDLLIYPLTAGLILSLSSDRSGWLDRSLNVPVLVWLGGISYSLYMSHETVLWIANQCFRVLLKRPEAIAGGRSVPQLSIYESAIAYPVAMIFVIAVAYGTFRLMENPFRQKSRALLVIE